MRGMEFRALAKASVYGAMSCGLWDDNAFRVATSGSVVQCAAANVLTQNGILRDEFL
jgi:hypothetical protein